MRQSGGLLISEEVFKAWYAAAKRGDGELGQLLSRKARRRGNEAAFHAGWDAARQQDAAWKKAAFAGERLCDVTGGETLRTYREDVADAMREARRGGRDGG